MNFKRAQKSERVHISHGNEPNSQQFCHHQSPNCGPRAKKAVADPSMRLVPSTLILSSMSTNVAGLSMLIMLAAARRDAAMLCASDLSGFFSQVHPILPYGPCYNLRHT